MDQTFIFADLAGFTAMTEALGDQVAAEVAIAFCAELNRLLPPDGEDLKSLGDSCMVRIPSASDAVRFGLRLVHEAAADRPFPAVRVGMHTGPAVNRGGDWFGRAVNIAARVAALPAGGEVMLTEATVEHAGELDDVAIDDLGPRTLKNVREPAHLYRATRPGTAQLVPVDPVCQMRLPEGTTRIRLPGVDATYCSERCAHAV